MAGSVNPDRRQKATQGGLQVGGKIPTKSLSSTYGDDGGGAGLGRTTDGGDRSRGEGTAAAPHASDKTVQSANKISIFSEAFPLGDKTNLRQRMSWQTLRIASSLTGADLKLGGG